MKRYLWLLCAAALLAGCAVQKEENPGGAGVPNETHSEADDPAKNEAQTADVAQGELPIAETEPAVEPSGLTDWQAAYREKLEEYRESDLYFAVSAFDLHDLNGDGIPELLISPDIGHVTGCEIYTYDQELIYVDEAGSWGTFNYCEEKQVIHSSYTGMGEFHVSCLKLEGHELVLLDSFRELVDPSGNDENAGEEAAYYLNDAEVSQEVYDAAFGEYIQGELLTVGRAYDFSQIDEALISLDE